MRIKITSCWVVAYMLCCATNPPLNAQQVSVANYTLKHFNASNGFKSNQTRGIVQDSLGYIWIASAFGLSRYDGYSFKSYTLDPDDNFRSAFRGGIRMLTVDRSGTLWVISDLLSKYDAKTDNFIHFKPEVVLRTIKHFCFEEDGTTVWMGTSDNGIFRFDTKSNQLVNYKIDHPDSLTRAMRNSNLSISDRGSTLLVAGRQGLWVFDKETQKFSRPACAPKDSALLFKNIWHIFDQPSANGNDTWLLLDKRLVKIDAHFSIVQRFDSPESFRSNYCIRDMHGIFWFVNDRQQFFIFNPVDGSFKHHEIKTAGEKYVFELDLFIDRDKNIWSGSEAAGAFQLIPQSLSFYNFKFPQIGRWTVSSIHKLNNRDQVVLTKTQFDDKAELWTGFPVLHESLDSAAFRKLTFHKPIQGFIMSTAIGKNTLWVCSFNMGVTGVPIDESGSIETENSFTLESDPSNPNQVSNSSNAFVYVDGEQHLWIVSRGNGLTSIDLSKPYGSPGSLARYIHDEKDSTTLSHNYSLRIYPAEEKGLWILTWAGIDLFRNGTFEHVFTKIETPRTIAKSSDGSLLIGTMRGLYEAKEIEGKYHLYEIPQMKDWLVEDVLEDNQGRLWITDPLANRLACLDRKKNIVVEFVEADGLPTGITDLAQTSEGVMVLTSIQGFTTFDPLALQIEKGQTLPVLTALKVNNKIPSLGNDETSKDNFSVETHISELEELVLDHRHNNFTIEFSAMEMTAPGKNLYRHMLEGFDTDWVETNSNNRTASYTNLDAGTYYFKVMASTHYGLWTGKERVLVVRILPPPWKSWWAYTAYATLVAVLLVLARRAILQRERLKANLRLAKVQQEKEHFELEKAKEVDKVKSAFFTNISHEFRTPLTLIKGPVSDMMEEFGSHPVVKERLKLIQRNADFLLKLINQLLDLARLESGSLTVDKKQINLNAFLGTVIASFSSMAAQKDITLQSTLPATSYSMMLDQDKLETILVNLINNAIKFTPAKGSVTVQARIQRMENGMIDQLVVTVSDTGIGIPAAEHAKIFERFHQVSDAHKEVGTGIGLSLVKELTALLAGTVSVTSEPGAGSEFIVTLPIDIVGIVEDVSEIAAESVQLHPFVADRSQTSESGEHPSVLVVEDNDDLRNFIIDSLGKDLHFLEASDGQQGLKIAIAEVPDLIISDVMMPDMDGITMTGKLENDLRTSHIPVLLLTAKASEESKLSGLRAGADYYLTKPFNKKELQLKVRNAIALRSKLREKLRLELLSQPQEEQPQTTDERFLFTVKQAIMSRLSDAQLSVESLAEEMGLSRSQLFRKISALAGITVNELIRSLRLQRAAQLLEQNSASVKEIAAEVGLSDVSYFSKIFKERFNVLPSEYMASKERTGKISQQPTTPDTIHNESFAGVIYSKTRKENISAIKSDNGVPPTVLLVEDNTDMRSYIRSTLSAEYHIIEAENGQQGIDMAQETVPDLIISDIMMPEVDGFTLCETIKTTELTSHIPVILLTAKADRESKIAGLQTQADDYLTKPFDTDELRLIVRNRIEARRKMFERLSREITLEPGKISITSMDEKFLRKVLAIIEDHMDDEKFSIEDFSRQAGFSQVQFFRKIKALTDQSPSQFLRAIRLKRAADLLAKNSDNISQIAYSVGFGSVSYFNKCFKDQFGVTPGQFVRSNEHQI